MQSIFNSVADCKLWNGALIPPNQEALILRNGIWTRWRFAVGSVSVDTFEYVAFAPTVNGGVGKWLLSGNTIAFKFPFAWNTPHNAVLWTVPLGFIFYITHSALAEVTIDFEGNDGHAIGISPGAAADFGALTWIDGLHGAGFFGGNDGIAPYDPTQCVMLPGSTFINNQAGGVILYTAGAGFWHVVCEFLQL